MMKRLLFLILFFAAVTSALATVKRKAHAHVSPPPQIPIEKVLVQLHKNYGHSPFKPDSITILSSGKIVYQKSDEFRAPIIAGMLSKVSVESLRKTIASIDPNAHPVDPYPNDPYCIDAPSTTVHVMLKGQLKLIYKAADCHVHTMDQAHKFLDLSIGFLNLFPQSFTDINLRK